MHQNMVNAGFLSSNLAEPLADRLKSAALIIGVWTQGNRRHRT
jgi:hypothetical protein